MVRGPKRGRIEALGRDRVWFVPISADQPVVEFARRLFIGCTKCKIRSLGKLNIDCPRTTVLGMELIWHVFPAAYIDTCDYAHHGFLLHYCPPPVLRSSNNRSRLRSSASICCTSLRIFLSFIRCLLAAGGAAGCGAVVTLHRFAIPNTRSNTEESMLQNHSGSSSSQQRKR